MQAPTMAATTMKKIATPLKLEYAWNKVVLSIIRSCGRLCQAQEVLYGLKEYNSPDNRFLI